MSRSRSLPESNFCMDPRRTRRANLQAPQSEKFFATNPPSKQCQHFIRRRGHQGASNRGYVSHRTKSHRSVHKAKGIAGEDRFSGGTSVFVIALDTHPAALRHFVIQIGRFHGHGDVAGPRRRFRGVIRPRRMKIRERS